MLFTRSPIFPGRFYDHTEYLVAYSFVNIFSPTDRDALLHHANDDGVAIWLNDAPVVRDTITGLNNFHTQPIHLKQGRNRLLHKSEQSVGGHFFHLRLTDPTNRPFPDITVTTAPSPPSLSASDRSQVSDLIPSSNSPGILSESLSPNRIRFTTDAIGLPHIIKCSYFPNWKVKGAAAVHRVTPAFMLVYPTQPDVELYWARTNADRLGLALSTLALLWALIAFFRTKFQSSPRSEQG